MILNVRGTLLAPFLLLPWLFPPPGRPSVVELGVVVVTSVGDGGGGGCPCCCKRNCC